MYLRTTHTPSGGSENTPNPAAVGGRRSNDIRRAREPCVNRCDPDGSRVLGRRKGSTGGCSRFPTAGNITPALGSLRSLKRPESKLALPQVLTLNPVISYQRFTSNMKLSVGRLACMLLALPAIVGAASVVGHPLLVQRQDDDCRLPMETYLWTTCSSFLADYNITLPELLRLNPLVGADCSGFVPGSTYCLRKGENTSSH